jgi:hypothetical protein
VNQVIASELMAWHPAARGRETTVSTQEHRLRVMSGRARVSEAIFMARGMVDRRTRDLYLCGNCSILFADACSSAIRAGTPGSCSNCGAVNQL